jgi:DNA-3-methyladenine glycosylase II
MADATPAAEASRAFSAADFARARRILMRRDPRLAAVIKRVGPCKLADSRTHDPFAALVRVIMSQQLSGKAAETIFARVVALAAPAGGLSPVSVRALDATALRGAGVSRPKITYLYDLADHVGDGRLDLHALDGHPDEEVIARITAVKGLGRWSAEMFLMFRLNRPDILPVGDLGIVKGMQRLFGMKRRPAERTMIRLAEGWRPYRSIASWYVWRV